MIENKRINFLDLLRGSAAFLVLSGHVRGYLLSSYGMAGDSGLHITIFYFITGLGHQAVIVFFALSGFLVGGRAFVDILQQRFSWRRYLLRRLTRLWLVIIPALLLTLLFDNLGIWLSGGLGYNGEFYDIYNSGPRGPAAVSRSILTFLGNIAFLQTIYVPPFGTDGPIWSLANNFWYYVTFPLACWLLCARRIKFVERAIGLSILALIFLILPWWFIEGGIVWIAGAAAALAAREEKLGKLWHHSIVRAGFAALCGLALVGTKLTPGDIVDIAFGFTVAATLPVLVMLPPAPRSIRFVSLASSEISYTLYLTHFPLLTFIVLTGFAPHRLQPSVMAVVLYMILLLIAVGWATIIWWCFERNTNRVYNFLSVHLAPGADRSEQLEARKRA